MLRIKASRKFIRSIPFEDCALELAGEKAKAKELIELINKVSEIGLTPIKESKLI